MFQKLANAVADQVIYKLAALNQAYSQNDTLAALRMEKRAHLQAAMKLAQLEKEAANLDEIAMDDYLSQMQSAGKDLANLDLKTGTDVDWDPYGVFSGTLVGSDMNNPGSPRSARNYNKAKIDAFKQETARRNGIRADRARARGEIGITPEQKLDLERLKTLKAQRDQIAGLNGQLAAAGDKYDLLNKQYNSLTNDFMDVNRKMNAAENEVGRLTSRHKRFSDAAKAKLNRANNLNKILGGSLAGLGLAGGAGLGALGIANARKAKQLAKLKQLGLLGGGAAALGGLGLGYLMGDN